MESEPYEEVTIDVDKEYMGVIVEEMGKRKGEMLDTSNNDQGITRLVYRISSRNLLGLRSDLVTKTRGSMLFSSQLLGYFPKGDAAPKLRSGALVAFERGTATRYALGVCRNAALPLFRLEPKCMKV